ncbi:MAG: hypothetical protein RLZZ127_307 [Planctomycetota bacterium]|jgi:methionyl-tRNA formyltransferase
MLRTIFMGTPDIAVPALRVLAARTAVQVVITQPDRPAGRGNRLTPPPVKAEAERLGLPVWQPERLRDHEDDPRLAGVDLAVVMAFGQILRQKVLDLPAHGCVNLHASLLPRWRGASPLQAALRAGDPETGISVMRMVRACDAGPVYARHPLPLAQDATLPWLHDALADLAATALDAFLAAWPPPLPEPQDESQATHCGKLGTEHGRIDPALAAVELARQVRAYTPAPGCWVPEGDGRLRILAAHAVPGSLPPGTWAAAGDALHLGTTDGILAITRLQSPGGKPLPAADWLRGHDLPA